jgi:asparagine synthase (glutamine-hydrolysing)
VQQFSARRIEEDDNAEAWWPKVHSFACGLEGSPDLVAAQTVAESIGTTHHSVIFTEQEGIDALKEVIYHLETYDVTTIRASTPMYLMARKIKAMGVKMVLSGEGADEIFGGYLYFHKAPNSKEFHEELNRKLNKLHMFDNLRANKSMSAWGIEARVPFLDKNFMDVAMRINPEDKMCGNGKMEKGILRSSFEGYLPKEILWRQKEQFSDGVGYSWIDSLKEFIDTQVTEQQLASAEFKFPVNTPDTKEAYYYRCIFEGHFPLPSAADCVPGGKSVACSTPEALAWDASFQNNADPSGRAVMSVHNDGYDEQ